MFQSYFLSVVTGTTDQNYATKYPKTNGWAGMHTVNPGTCLKSLLSKHGINPGTSQFPKIIAVKGEWGVWNTSSTA